MLIAVRSSGTVVNGSEGGPGAARPAWAGDKVCKLGKLPGKLNGVMEAYILPYFSVFYMDLFGEGPVFKSLSLDMIRWSVTCCHHMCS